MAGGAAGSCLSDLSDDLLRHILFFAPAREGAATAVLSRRWRWLWRTSGAVNLDSRSWKSRRSTDEPSNRKRSRSRSRSSISNSAVFLRSAKKALAAAQDPIRRLTFFLEEDSEVNLMEKSSSGRHSLIETLVSHPAARRVEELWIEVKPHNIHCTLSMGSLPSEALRVLRIVTSTTLMAALLPSAAMFPRLADLHLHGCKVDLEDLRSTIAAAPQLSTLHLQSSYLFHVLDKNITYRFGMEIDSVCCLLRCPAVTTLVFAYCSLGCAYRKPGMSRLDIYLFDLNGLEVDLDVPMLQYFRYEGSVFDLTSRLRLNRHASNNMIQQVDLSLTYGRHDPHPGRQICESFWQFVQSFSTTRRLRLQLDLLMDDLVAVDKATKDVLLGSLSFCRLQQLELEGKYMPGFEISMALLADLLRCCPVVRDLRLKFSKIELEGVSKDEANDDVLVMLWRQNPSVRRWILANIGKKLDNGVGQVMHIKLQHDDNYHVYGIPGLTTEHAFSCLQSHLKRVSLDFSMDGSTCVGFKLAKFFAENAMVLQEMHVDGCGQEMLEHLDPSVRKLMAANTDQKKHDKVWPCQGLNYNYVFCMQHCF